MIALILVTGVLCHRVLRHAPTNRLLNHLRVNPGPSAAVVTATLALTYLLAALTGTALLQGGGPDWLNAMIALGLWNGIKLLVATPIVFAWWLRARFGSETRTRSARQRRRHDHSQSDLRRTRRTGQWLGAV